MSVLLRGASAVALCALGAVSALAAVLLHGDWWGLLLGWAVLLSVTFALPLGWHGRPAFALGWIVVLVSCLGSRPEGDFVVASNLPGYALLAGAPALVVFAMTGFLSRNDRSAGRDEIRPLDVAS